MWYLSDSEGILRSGVRWGQGLSSRDSAVAFVFVFQNGQLHVCAEDPERGHAGCGCCAADEPQQGRAVAALPSAAGEPAVPREKVFQAAGPAVRRHRRRAEGVAMECPVERYRRSWFSC